MVVKKVLSGLFVGVAFSVSPVHAQVEPPQGGAKVTESGVVKIYTLPQDLQTVLEGDDGKYYAINYYTWVNPEESDGSDPIPGISVGSWWDDPQVSMFFPWGDDEALAEELSGVGGEALDVSSLSLGVERVEGEARLPRAGHAGHHDELLLRQVDVDGLEVVLAGAADLDVIELFGAFGSASRRAATSGLLGGGHRFRR